MRVVVTSDLHHDEAGDLTAPAAVARLANEIRALRPDAIVLAGDLGHRLREFRACLEHFIGCAPVIGVLVGNHDVWRDDLEERSSQSLFEEHLPAITRELGFVWLEEENIEVGPVAIVGSAAWYDYSAIDPRLRARFSDDQLEALKGTMNNDAHWVDWPWTDRAFASRLGKGMLARLDLCEAKPAVERILVVTHVPLLESQMIRKDDDDRWALSNAYFGNLSLGDEVQKRGKVRAIVSGHTHGHRRARVGAIDARVVGSDYGEPAFELVEL